MKRLNLLLLVLALTLLAAFLVPSAAYPDGSIAQAASLLSAKVNPRVLAATANGSRSDFLIVLREQANLAAAAQLKTKDAKGTFVYNALRAVANRTQPPVLAALDRLGLKYQSYYVMNLIAVRGGERAAVQQLAARPDVARIEPDAPYRVQLPKPELPPSQAPQGIEWNISKINAPQVWNLGYKGQGLVYANQDTGVSWTHPALIHQYRGTTAAGFNHNYNWWDAIHTPIVPSQNPCGYSSPFPCDDNGHGTHTMGTGVGDDGKGNQIGVAPAAKWIACHNMDQNTGRPSTYTECFQFFIAPWNLQGKNPDPSKAPDVVSNSWVCPSSEQCVPNSLQTIVENVRAAGIVVVASAGNSGPGCSTVSDPPAIYDASTTIGATDSTDTLASFSSRGPVTSDGSNRLKPDISAPGVNVRSSFYIVSTHQNTYATLSGTSMSSPHVAGSVLLLWNAHPELIGNVDATEQAFFSTANINVTVPGNPVCGGTGPGDIPNNLFGYGRIDVYAAVQSIP
jgi:serine protease AprX